MPAVVFTCQGTITRWRAGGERVEGASLPQLQVWRERNPSRYSRVAQIPLLSCNGVELDTPAGNVYECELATQVPVRSGDFLGIYSRGQFQVYFDGFTSTQDSSAVAYYRAGTGSRFSVDSEKEIVDLQRPLVALDVESK